MSWHCLPVPGSWRRPVVSIIHMEIGEPDFVTPQPVIDAGIKALSAGYTHYTPATGLPALRERIAAFYSDRYGVKVSPGRIVVTPGASLGLQLALAHARQ